MPESLRGEYFVSRLANLVHPRGERKKVFGMIQVYLDESGIHGDAHACVVAGYTGSVASWKKFERPWRRLLKRFKLSEFHAQRFWGHQDGAKRSSPFNTWTDHQADEFLNEVFRIIENSRIAPVAAAVPLEDWKMISEQYRHFLTGGDFDAVKKAAATPGAPTKSYYLALAACITNAARHARAGTKVHFVLDLNQQLAPYATILFQKFRERGSLRVRTRLGGMSFENSQVALPLQAADLLAFQFFKHIEARKRLGATVRNPILERALCNLKSPHDIPLYNAAGLDLVLKDLKDS